MENKLEGIRHTLAHLMAQAVVELYPNTLPTIGPAVENGWYYDFDFGDTKLTDADLSKIEEVMRKNLAKWTEWQKEEVSSEKALEQFKNNPYKTELINEFGAENKTLTFYTCGGFLDLCRGGHCEHPAKEISPDSFKIEKLAGAYWRGSAENKMLTRIYGLAFSTKEELEKFIWQQEEAKKRDHRKLGGELELFTFSPLVGAGLPIWLEHGATIRRELERFITDTELEWGYMHVYTPDIAKIDLYKTSGHYPYYKDSMYSPIDIDGDLFMLRPMTCPHHFQVYGYKPRSYRDLPMRIAELAKLYRYEASGELSGLVRVRGFCLADAHIVCADPEQAKQEVHKALDLIEYVASVFGLKVNEDYRYRLSLGDRNDSEKYFKNDEAWDKGESILRELLQERKCNFFEAEQEAAFYGPKIDIQMKDVKGKENTAFTVQYDFCMPGRFKMTYVDKDGKDKEPIIVHRSSIGAIERVMAFLIEKFAGAFPVWLSPVQVSIVPVKPELHNEFATKVLEILKEKNIRAELDDRNESLGKRIRAAKEMKVPYVIVIGDKERDSGNLTVESRTEKIEGISAEDFANRVEKEIKERALN